MRFSPIEDPETLALVQRMLAKKHLIPVADVVLGQRAGQAAPGDYIQVNVKGYGASPTATAAANDAAFAAALADLASRGGGALYIPGSSVSFKLGAPLTLSENVILKGDGLASCLEWDADLDQDVLLIKAPGALGTGALIEGCGIDRLRLKFNHASQRVFCQRFLGLRIDHVRIDSSILTGAACAIFLDGGSLTLPSPEALVDWASDAHIEHLTTYGFLQAVGSSGARVTQTNIYRGFHASYLGAAGVAAGICFDNISGGSQLVGNEIEGFDVGIRCVDGDCSIVANRFEGNATNDVYLKDSCQGCAVVGNNHSSASVPIKVDRLDGNLILAPDVARLSRSLVLHSLEQFGPRLDMFSDSESSGALLSQAVLMTIGGGLANLFGETVTAREGNLCGNNTTLKIGTTGNYPARLMARGAPRWSVEPDNGNPHALNGHGGILTNTLLEAGAALPPADADHKNRLFIVTGPPAVLYVCLNETGGTTYAWKQVATG